MTATQPVDLLLWCPECGARHVDEGEFETKVHHTHACQQCGMVWRPAVVPTRGVRYLPGFKCDELQENAERLRDELERFRRRERDVHALVVSAISFHERGLEDASQHLHDYARRVQDAGPIDVALANQLRAENAAANLGYQTVAEQLAKRNAECAELREQIKVEQPPELW